MHPILKTKQALGVPAGLLLAISALAALPAPVGAVQTFYVGPNNGTWTDGNNWDGGTAPVAGDDAVVGAFIPGRTTDVNVTFNATYTSGTALKSVTLDTTGTTGSVIVNQTAAGSSLYAGSEVIGSSTARNVFNQSAGTNSISNLSVGDGAGAAGTYNLSGSGNLTAAIGVGVNSGSGVFNMSAGSLSGSLGVGSSPTGFSPGTGIFNQTGGTVSASGIMSVGYNSGGFGVPTSDGTYNLGGGNLNTQNPIIGSGNSGPVTGRFIQTGGTHSITGQFSGSGGSLFISERGVYTLAGGTLTVASGNGNNGSINNSGTFNISNASVLNGAFDTTNNQGALVRATGASITYTGAFTNNGAYVSEAALPRPSLP